MVYLTPAGIYRIWETLRERYDQRAEGQTFRPVDPIDHVMAKLGGAASRPRQSYGDHEPYRTIFEKVAALGHGVTAGHCFGNGNKRTGWVAMRLMLEINGWSIDVPSNIISFVMLRVASENSRMTIEELAPCLGAYAFISEAAAAENREGKDRFIERHYAVLDEPDIFPAASPPEPKAVFVGQASEILSKQIELMSGKEQEEFAATYRWPIVLTEILEV